MPDQPRAGETMKGKTLVKGHTLWYEGRVSTFHGMGSGPGRGRCSCGAESETLPTTAARQRWHREHKETIRTAREENDRLMAEAMYPYMESGQS